MNRRKVGLALVVVVLLGVIALVWRRRGGDDGGDDEAARKTAAGEGGGARGRARAKIDVKTVARGSISGTVRDPGGKAIGGARVCGTVWSEELPEEETREPLCVTTTADGLYTLENLLPGHYDVHAQAPSYIPARFEEKSGRRWGRSFKLAAGEARRKVDIVLRPGGVLVKGTVVDIG